MSASRMPTLRPCRAIETARLTVTEDLPTPPLPDATAYTRVSESGRENGISFSATPPRSWVCNSARCSGDITPSSTSTAVTPSIRETAAVTSRRSVSFIGQPATVSSTRTPTVPSGRMSTASTMPRSVIGLRISGSSTEPSAAVTCSTVGDMPPTLRGVVDAIRSGVQLHQQRLEFRSQEVTGGDLAERHPQRGHLAGEELHVGPGSVVHVAVALVLD